MHYNTKIMKILTVAKDMPSTTKAIVAAAASTAATVMVIRTVARDCLPTELRNYIYYKLNNFVQFFSSTLTLVIQEYDSLNHSHLFKAAELYLEPIISPNTNRLKISLPSLSESKVSVSLDKNQEIFDTFRGITLKWKLVSREVRANHVPGSSSSNQVTEHKYFELSFHRKHKDMVLDDYIKNVIQKSKEIRAEKKKLKIFTLRQDMAMVRRGNVWQPANFDHPATFDILAMDMELKDMIIKDLDKFVKRRDYYKRVGKAWKRGYLLYGPPGTGKSSLIAAIANHLKFDIYDLELTDLKVNSDLRKLLISTGNKSILVVEDIDCSIQLQNRSVESRVIPVPHRLNQGPAPSEKQPQMTLSGLLNFMDGLWSSCGDERIIIFTTNHKEKLDPALLRPGRMDMHIHMSYCTPYGFKILASNYSGVTEHPSFERIEELIKITKATPAEIGEQLMQNEEPEIAFGGLIEFLEHKKAEEDKAKKKTVTKRKTQSDERTATKMKEESERSEADTSQKTDQMEKESN
ncbi:AAA-ATPase At3g50940-like [Mercurialis annua]|uniref:AAA-ATPase At3g50940-like n=1 Tax=Mercurialis annua TaxID=3986 RepID=UPI002160832C|nr:AAA-ATPase At3g50940-like [Mercurialis annua]